MAEGTKDTPSGVSALLGPTNTGKTHRAIERMLDHPSGMIGLPLRLLAREVYDRVSSRCGESQVALVTGEEKRIPARPRYWVCTVEAMPTSTEVDFLAVDEVQLAGHAERGHVFTERLLHARGRAETWFLGSETMRDALAELLPDAAFSRSPRLSMLRAAGETSIAGLPKRSAVVAFSLPRVFELAERIKKKRGGAAVVVGALSPRARNAQVSLYQAGEVDFLVATDAIGMGLNLDIDHVAFADVRKFDGRVARDLDAAELAQIAGRAGRYVRDGTFGTLAPLPELGPGSSRAIETHRFQPVKAVWWRNPALDMGSIGDLLASLRQASPGACLKRMERAVDQAVLARLADRPEVVARARDEEGVRLLWSACSIPDYRQILFEDHVALVSSVFLELAEKGQLAAARVQRELDEIERATNDLEALMDRIASIRIWNYVANQAGWVEQAKDAQERARAIEDALSDALHGELVARFVDRDRPAARRARESDKGAALPSSPFAKLAALAASLPGSAPSEPDVRSGSRFVERLIEAPHAAFDVDAAGAILFESRPVGRLTSGRTLATPETVVTLDLAPGDKLRAGRRLLAFSRDLVAELVGALAVIDGLSPAGRGVAHLLSAGLGTALARDARAQLDALTEEESARLTGAGVVLGTVVLYLAVALKPPMMKRRLALASAFTGGLARRSTAGRRSGRGPADGDPSMPPIPGVSAELHTAIGYITIGPRAVRADILERLANRLRALPETPPNKLAGWLGCSPSDAALVAAFLTP